MMRRIFLFVLTNILIIATISIVLSLLGVPGYLQQTELGYQIDYGALLIFCLVWGMGGAFISLAMSRFMAKMLMRIKLIDPNSAVGDERELYQMVQRLSAAAGLPKTPEVGVYQNSEVNAFATGPTKSRALVAVSSGLLQQMRRNEVEGVLGHEVAHIANGDMVTMTLVQGVVNAFVMFFARILAFAVSNLLSRGNDEGPNQLLHFGLVIAFQIAFGFLGMFVVAYVSRAREYRADAGSSKLAGREKMIAALEALRATTRSVDNTHESLATLKISGKPKSIMSMLSTHPPLEERIQRLKMMTA